MNDTTKSKILEVASRLFAEQGLEGTSIREISREADVNLAAINYHFKSKENLYLEVFTRNYQWMEEGIAQIGANENLNTREFAWRMYQFFTQNSDAMMNSFKIILNKNIDFTQAPGFLDKGEGEIFGPPGAKYMLPLIQKDVGNNVDFEQCHWAMRMIFSVLVHFGVLMGTSFIKANCDRMPFMSSDQKQKDIYQLVDAILGHLKKA